MLGDIEIDIADEHERLTDCLFAADLPKHTLASTRDKHRYPFFHTTS